MNVLHLLPTNQFGGAEKVVLQLAKYDNENSIIVACGKNVTKIFKDNGINVLPIDISDIRSTMMKIKCIVEENKINIIHAHDNRISIIAYITKKFFRLNVKLISHIHNNYPWLVNFNKYKLIDKIFRNKYDINIYCGKTVEEYYLEYGKYIDSKKTRVLSNAIEILPNIKYVNKDTLKISNKYVYGFIGRLTEQKGLEPFIKELSKHIDKFSECVFIIIGDGDKSEEIKELVKTLNLDEYFIFLGFQEDIYKFFGAIDTIIVPSIYEGLPMIILEAMANYQVVVSMNVGSISEVIKDDETGILVNKGCYDQFINRLLDIKKDKELRNVIKVNASNYIKDNYNVINQIKNLNNIYKNVQKG